MTKLFVGSLDWNTSDEDLRSHFAQVGEVVDAKVILDRDTGRSRGFGFVTLAEAAMVQRAIQALDGSDLAGRAIRVSEANDRPQRSGGGGGDRRDSGSRRW